ncbi:hypothetical protein ACA910_012839 [Epithemia clementina (nom. ined.)]
MLFKYALARRSPYQIWCRVVLEKIHNGGNVRRGYDPTAKRPNKVCDPFGQGGKPLTAAAARSHQATIHGDWKLVTITRKGDKVDDSSNDGTTEPPPDRLVREFYHVDFLTGAKFLGKVAAVAVVNNHFPSLELDRIIINKQWHTISRVTFRTKVLDGLSSNDFFLAMMIDVETNRPEITSLYIQERGIVGAER